MAANLGAHEVLEMHEVLNCTIDGINQFQLYRTFAQDSQLQQIMDNQLTFMTAEYDSLVGMLEQQGMGEARSYRAPQLAQPQYGLDHPAQMAPGRMGQLQDRDVASSLLGFHKTSASKKMLASLECADPQLRRTMQQSAINCSEQAYEVWQYMNQKGYYQVPTMKETTTQTVLGSYAPSGMAAQSGMNQGMSGMQLPQ